MNGLDGCTIDVCYGCLSCLVNGECDSDTGDCEHMSRVSDAVEITPGCLDCDPCECGCGWPSCECPYGGSGHGFSWRTCQGCGDTRGGERYPVTVWYPCDVCGGTGVVVGSGIGVGYVSCDVCDGIRDDERLLGGAR